MIGRTPARRGPEAVEWMDAGVGSAEENAEAYRLLDRVNRLQGGHRLTLSALDDALAAGALVRSRPIVFADLAGGDGGFAARVVEWGRSRGTAVRAVVLDLGENALGAARGAGRPVDLVRADVLAAPLLEGSIDVVHCSCFFHHLSILDARDLLVEMCRASRGVVIVSELVRSHVAAASIWVATRLLVGNHLVRHDGPLSVLKSYTPDELRSIAHAATATAGSPWRWRLVRTFPYRMALVGARLPSARGRRP